MNTEQRIKQIADEAIEKIRAIAADKEEWPKVGDDCLNLTIDGSIWLCEWYGNTSDKSRQDRRRIAPNTTEGRARLERLTGWEVFFADFMTAGDAKPGERAFFVEIDAGIGCLTKYHNYFGAAGQRGFTTEAKRDEWLNKWGRDYVEKMLKGGMP